MSACRRLFAATILLLGAALSGAATPAVAQSHPQMLPNGGDWVKGYVPSPPEWMSAFGNKVDVTNGALTSPTIVGGSADNVVIGATTPASGNFSSLSVLGVPVLTGTGGSPTQVIFNSGGLPTGDSTFTFNNSTKLVTTAGLDVTTGGAILTNPAAAPTLTLSGNAGTVANGRPCTQLCVSGFVSGTVTSGAATLNSFVINDDVLSTSNSDGFLLSHNMASNGNVASGPRVTLEVNLTQTGTGTVAATFNGTVVGNTLTINSGLSGTVRIGAALVGSTIPALTYITAGSGTSWTIGGPSLGTVGPESMSTTGSVTNAGISDAARLTSEMKSNLGGSTTNHVGAITNFNVDCQIYNTATYAIGTLCSEYDLDSQAGSTFQQNGMFLMVERDLAEGSLGPAYGMVFDGTPTAIGVESVLQIGAHGSSFPVNQWGGLLQVQTSLNQSGNPTLAAYGFDTAAMQYHGCEFRTPYSATCHIFASGITSATRLTTDGLAASGFLLGVQMTNVGTLYTLEPSTTVTGCTGAVVNTQVGGPSGGTVAQAGVFTPGTGCIAESTIAFTNAVGDTTGSGAAAIVLVSGNTLNLPINSTNIIDCRVAVQDSGPGHIGYTITFVATMGATSSTTAIVGSPTWTAIGTDSAISLAAPTADTTLGAINITLTPTAVTANVGGTCNITSSKQVI